MPNSSNKSSSKKKSEQAKKTKNISYAINKEGKAYRSFKLLSVEHKKGGKIENQLQNSDKSHTAVNRSKKTTSNASHLGPLRGAQKIFDAWCRENEYSEISDTKFVIQETTRGKYSRLYCYIGKREKLDKPREVMIKGSTKPIKYMYRSRVRSFREKNQELKKKTVSKTINQA
tara:strand:- start:374 stop:892 length:519 start_codon:yes stop_codon:yes gene_type:complete